MKGAPTSASDAVAADDTVAVSGDATASVDVADTGEGEETAVGVGDFFRRIYAVTYSKTVGLVIILLFALLVLFGVIFTQAPVDTWPDSAARADFLTQMTAKYGSAASFMGHLGLFHIFTTIGFYVVTIALAISIIGCTTHRIPQLWQRWRHPHVTVSPRFFEAARYRASVATDGPAAASMTTVVERLRAARYRVIEVDDHCAYADRFAWGGFGTVVAHLSFIVILGAFLLSGLASYSVVLNLPIGGAAVAVGHNTNLSVAVADYNESYDDATGQPTDYVSTLDVYQAGQLVKTQHVRVNTPLSLGAWTFYQYTGLGFAVDIQVVSADGSTLFDGTVPLQYYSTDNTLSIGIARIESLGLSIQVEVPVSGTAGVNNSLGLAAGQAAFLLFLDGQDAPDNMDDLGNGAANVDPGATYTHKDLNLTFLRETQTTGIKVRTDPGTVFVWIGGILLVIGMTVTFACRQRRLWLRTEDGHLLLASADKEDSGFRQNFVELVDQARDWFSVESSQPPTEGN